MPTTACTSCAAVIRWWKKEKTVCLKCADMARRVCCPGCKQTHIPHKLKNLCQSPFQQYCKACQKQHTKSCETVPCSHPIVMNRPCVTCKQIKACKDFTSAYIGTCRSCLTHKRRTRRAMKQKRQAELLNAPSNKRVICQVCQTSFHIAAPSFQGTATHCLSCASGDDFMCRECDKKLPIRNMSWLPGVCVPCRQQKQRNRKRKPDTRHVIVKEATKKLKRGVTLSDREAVLWLSAHEKRLQRNKTKFTY